MTSLSFRCLIESGVQPDEVHEFAPLKLRKGRCYVYVASDERGRVLYVGIAVDVYRRLGQHAQNSEWYELCAHLRVEDYRARMLAQAREAHLIGIHAPPFNKKLHAGMAYRQMRRAAAIAAVRNSEAT